jgi:hypothetical protein
MLTVVCVGLFVAATSTKNYSVTQVGGWRFYSWSSSSMTAATDTVLFTGSAGYIPLSPPKSANDTVVGFLGIYTGSSDATASGDSVYVNVRLEVSSDGSTWKSYTIGTDSTSWLTTVGASSFTYCPVIVTRANLSGYHPYGRIRVIGRSTQDAGARIKATFAEAVQ